MAKKPEPMKLEEGKVYLRDTRNGKIRQYEDTLAQMSYMQRFVHGEDTATTTNLDATTTTNNITLTGLDRAAEWDRKAAMKPKEREAAEKKAAKSDTDTVTGLAVTASGALATPPQTVTAPAPAEGGTLSAEQVQTNATAPATAPATASGTVTPPAPPAPPKPPAAPAKAADTKK